MYEIIKENQLNTMLVLIGACGVLAIFLCITQSLSKRRKVSLVMIELCSMGTLMADRWTYLYNGVTSTKGIIMSRISYYSLFALTLLIIYSFNLYIKDILLVDCELKKMPPTSFYITLFFLIGAVLLSVSQFAGLYYYFDENNIYHRGSLYILSFVAPFIIIALEIYTIYKYANKISKKMKRLLIICPMIPVFTSGIQIFMYGLSTISIIMALILIMLFFYAYLDMNNSLQKEKDMELKYAKIEQTNTKKLFEQTAEALANAIDAKDNYTHGHSTRVAEYSKRIAEKYGMSQKECEEVYYAALLHDVGKIGIPDTIINKVGKLTKEEYEIVKKHPEIGEQILLSINISPYLSMGAGFHHERYDGKGYPRKLKGNDIPLIARIIAVADAYDAMTSKRSYRDPLPQEKVKEEIIKGAGAQFDPVFANIMKILIEEDRAYEMKEYTATLTNKLSCDKHRDKISKGIRVIDHTRTITFNYKSKSPGEGHLPSIILYDSIDGRIHEDEKKKKEFLYEEYAEIKIDGKYKCDKARNISISQTCQGYTESGKCYININKIDDHVRIEILNNNNKIEIILALPDSTRYVYIALTGEQCKLYNINVLDSDDIPQIMRIAEKVSYIDGPEGNIPNVQIDGFCKNATKGIMIQNSLKLLFHTKALPTARLIWHCPYINIFYSADGKVNGKDYINLAMIRLDGEECISDENAENTTLVDKDITFTNWDKWKEINKIGMDCNISITKINNEINVYTHNGGIKIMNKTVIKKNVPTVYVALTGDQCVLTNIRISLL